MWASTAGAGTFAFPLHTVGSNLPFIISMPPSRTSLRRRCCRGSRPAPLRYGNDSPYVPEVEDAVNSLQSDFRAVDDLVARNTFRVLRSYQNARVGSHFFGGCTGYGHDEAGGREGLDQSFAEIFGSESAIVRSQFFSGTHAITCALFAILRPGDELLAVAGAPYDTLEEVIGKQDCGLGSLKDFGIKYREVPLAEDGKLNWQGLASALLPETRCVLIQRSCRYSWQKSF